MSKLLWDQTGNKQYETGVKQGVLYPQINGEYSNGVAWSGLTAVTESPSGAEPTPIYADDNKYLNLISAEEFGATIEAYTYPDEFAECDGSAEIATGVTIGQQNRKTFGFAYKTTLGNDTDGNEYGYKLHLLYGCLAAPSEKAYTTINDSPETVTFSWEVSTTPVTVSGFKPTANLTIDSTKANKTKLAVLEDILFGFDAAEFDAAKTYAVGTKCKKTTGADSSATVKYYTCTTAVETAGVWSDTNWTEITNPGPRLPLPDEVAEIMAEG